MSPPTGTKDYSGWCKKPSYINIWNVNSTITERNDDPVVKTIYDPSPVGYKLPAPNAYSGFTFDGENRALSFDNIDCINSPLASFDDVNDRAGYEFYCNKMPGKGVHDPSGGTIYFPNVGSRELTARSISTDMDYFKFWTAGVQDDSGEMGISSKVKDGNVFPFSVGHAYSSSSVRSVQE